MEDGPKKEKKDNTNFQPKFKDENAFGRRVKEFYGGESQKFKEEGEIPTSSVGHIGIKTEVNNTFDRKNFTNLTFKEKKILENFPNLTLTEIRQQAKKGERVKEKELAHKEIEQKTKQGDTSKSTYYNQLESNIFNNKKEYTRKSNKYNSITCKEDLIKEESTSNSNVNKDHKKKQTEDSAWSYNLNWKEIDSQLYFHKKEDG